MHQETTFIRNQGNITVLSDLLTSLDQCDGFCFTVAFMTFSGVQLLVQKLNELQKRGVCGRVLTSTYQQFSEPKAIEKLQSFQNIEVRLYDEAIEGGLHAKGYLFNQGEVIEIYIGSSNLTVNALKENIEWNVKLTKSIHDPMVKEVLADYELLWNQAGVLTKEKLDAYKKSYDRYKEFKREHVIELENELATNKEYQPNQMQQTAMKRLNALREKGAKKALVIAATGTGKTYMSAFDVAQVNPKKMLFIVHREEILQSAKKTFETVIKDQKVMGLYTGHVKDRGADYLFATVQTMSRYYKEYPRDYFDYVIIDEAHHVGGQTYQTLLNYFTPTFLLGMTATPERCDDFNIFDCFDGHVALEVRLREALEENLIVPFHYFGIHDIDGIDLSDLKLDQIHEITKRLNVNKRVEFILEQMNLFGHDGAYRKVLGFCVSVEHAEYMTQMFNEAGVVSECLTGKHLPSERQSIIKRLEDNQDPLEVIFTVDIFNEGVDIPSINMVLMLRPTQSPIIFIQQLGRGLRKQQDKEFLTVLDFIGNHNKSFLTAIALNGDRFYDKDSLKVAVATDFPDIPGNSFIMLDHVSKEQILTQLESENFNSMTYLKESYQEFKRMNRGQIPYMLCDYLKYEGAPDPVSFIKKEKTYLNFVFKVEKDPFLSTILQVEEFVKVMKEWSNQLPLRRPHEFILLNYLLHHPQVNHLDLDTAVTEVLKYVDSISEESVRHAMQYLGQIYYDSTEFTQYLKLGEYIADSFIVLPSFNQLRYAPHFKPY
ncbi:MAG: DEAD/DEAH box helicase family protein, partial [Turicibacter sp.]|nr:DEAD/DEAH box helicase family protein [Turicibacter sp.]